MSEDEIEILMERITKCGLRHQRCRSGSAQYSDCQCISGMAINFDFDNKK
jgi:hypothetical protein